MKYYIPVNIYGVVEIKIDRLKTIRQLYKNQDSYKKIT